MEEQYVKFLDSKSEELSSISDKIDRAMCKLVNINKMLKRKYYEVEVNLQEENRTGKRKRDNAYEDQIEKKTRLQESSHEVLKIIAPSVNKEGLENLLTEEMFGDIEVQQNHLVESPDLRPRFLT